MPLAGAGTLELEIPAAESLILLGFSSRAGGWRWKQSAAYRSQRRFPCYQGINWENFAILGLWTTRNTN
jgi:hypothetical protein